MSKRVLYLLPQPFLLSRGSSFRAYSTIEAILEAGYQVDMLCYPIGEAPEKLSSNQNLRIFRSASLMPFSSIKVGPSLKKIYLDIFFYFKAKQLIKENNYALVHGVEEAGLMAHRLAKRLSLPFIYDMHSWMSQQIEEGGFSFSENLLNKFKNLENSAIADSSAIITVGDAMSEILDQRLGKKKTYTLKDCPLSFDIEPSQKIVNKIKAEFFTDPSKKIVYTGNFHKYQGIDLLLCAIAELKKLAKVNESFNLLLVGGGAGDADNIKKYQAQAAKLGIEQEVVFCGEYPAETMPVFMNNADALVSPRSQGNNVPLKVYTYLSAGSLLVATNIESHTQVLNISNSILAEPEAKELAAALYFAIFEISTEEKDQIIKSAKSIGVEKQIEKFNQVVASCYAGILASKV